MPIIVYKIVVSPTLHELLFLNLYKQNLEIKTLYREIILQSFEKLIFKKHFPGWIAHECMYITL